jgi:serine O-acetyltransferase
MFCKRMVDHHGKGSVAGWLAKIMMRRYTYKYGFQIGGNIGDGFYIGHFGTVIVSVNAVIGKNCNIAPGVTIGASRRGEKKGAPSLGDFVWIGTNAVIVGAIHVGSDVLIAPGAYVNFDVPDHSIIVGNPGQIIARQNATEGYINNAVS